MFDHDRHWAERIRLYDITNKTELGRKLAMCMGGKANASNPAYLKRGNKWIDDHTEDGNFVMHNGLKSTPDLQSLLTTISWNQWLQDQAWYSLIVADTEDYSFHILKYSASFTTIRFRLKLIVLKLISVLHGTCVAPIRHKTSITISTNWLL